LRNRKAATAIDILRAAKIDTFLPARSARKGTSISQLRRELVRIKSRPKGPNANFQAF
jgi:hypothetical protein